MLIHVTGASGSGTSTLGKALAGELGGAFLDADDFFWAPSDPPFQARRPVEERRSLLLTEFSRSDIAVRSGSVTAWGVGIEDVFDFVVFLYVDTALRLERLRERELQRFGKANPTFLEWAAQYDEGPSEGRSLAKQQAWLSARRCPVLNLDGDLSTQERLARIRAWMGDHRLQCERP
ncbi:hypothetical protein LJR130_005969 [Variovorax sp. LjRoot130]|uniref:hypothetical protein n=1 Tax=Variovorax sp. LjRoot130 TaxID=3342261 RepID=UPI003ECE968F